MSALTPMITTLSIISAILLAVISPMFISPFHTISPAAAVPGHNLRSGLTNLLQIGPKDGFQRPSSGPVIFWNFIEGTIGIALTPLEGKGVAKPRLPNANGVWTNGRQEASVMICPESRKSKPGLKVSRKGRQSVALSLVVAMRGGLHVAV